MKPEPQILTPDRNKANSAVCVACSCFCHDLEWSEENGWLQVQKCKLLHQYHPILTELNLESQALEIIDHEIKNALKFNYPIAMTGLEYLSLESQQLAVKLAARIHAWVLDADGETSADPWELAFSQLGGWHASWSEVRLRSDGILLWFAPLWQTHPRWLERFGPRSHQAHRLAILSPETSIDESGWIEEQIVRLEPSHATTFLTELRLSLKRNENNHAEGRLRRLIHLFHNSHWLTLVRSNDPAGVQDRSALAHGFNRLVIESNEMKRRVVVANLSNTINSTGLNVTLSWHAGLPKPVRFSPEGPVFRPNEISPDDFRLVLAFGETIPEFNSAMCIHFNSVSEKLNRTDQSIQIPVSKIGWDTGGTIVRPDGIAIQVQPLSKSGRPHTSQILNAMINRLNAESDSRRTDS